MASERTIARVQAQIQRRIAHCLQFELSDPRSTFITITRVELNSDMSIAKVYYSVLGAEGDRARAAAMLDHAKGFIRKQVGSVLETRSIPELRFEFDETIANAERLEDILEEAKKRDAEIRGEGGE